MEFSLICSGISHLKCNVLPLCSSVAAMPETAVAKAILLVNLKKSKMTSMI